MKNRNMQVHKMVPPRWDGYTLSHTYYYIAYIAYLVIFVFLSAAIEPDALIVFLATFPILLSISMYSVLASLHPRRRLMLIATIFIPFFSSMFFVILYTSKVSSQVNMMDVSTVVVWQLIVSTVLLILSWLFVEHTSKSAHVAHARAQHGHPHPAQQHINHLQHTHTQNNNISEEVAQVFAPTNPSSKFSSPNPYYQQMVAEYAHAAQAHANRAMQLEEELNTARVAMSASSNIKSKEAEYKSQINALESELKAEKSAATQSLEKNAAYEKHISQLKTVVDKLKDKLEVSETNFTSRLRGIEDKAKAINFVIGRVYGDRNGGNATIRSKLNIDRELYNAFSEMSGDVSPENKKKLIDVLLAIQQKIINLELPEKKLFSLPKRAKLIRDVNGNDTILVVLSKNDSDPVVDYYVEAKEICQNMLEYLRK